jgi:hypothetical protein
MLTAAHQATGTTQIKSLVFDGDSASLLNELNSALPPLYLMID